MPFVRLTCGPISYEAHMSILAHYILSRIHGIDHMENILNFSLIISDPLNLTNSTIFLSLKVYELFWHEY